MTHGSPSPTGNASPGKAFGGRDRHSHSHGRRPLADCPEDLNALLERPVLEGATFGINEPAPLLVGGSPPRVLGTVLGMGLHLGPLPAGVAQGVLATQNPLGQQVCAGG